MAIDFKTAVRLFTKRFLAPTLVVFSLLGYGIDRVWTEYKEVAKEKEKLAADRKALNDEIVRSEKNRAEAAIALLEKKADLDKREFMLAQLEGQHKDKLALLQQQATDVASALDKLRSTESTLSEAQRKKEAEDRILALMSKFSAMGVDLNAALRCDDIEGERRFNEAKHIYSEIYTLIEANALRKKYAYFLNNGQWVHSSCRN